jgi:hypothetical protein
MDEKTKGHLTTFGIALAAVVGGTMLVDRLKNMGTRRAAGYAPRNYAVTRYSPREMKRQAPVEPQLGATSSGEFQDFAVAPRMKMH